MNQLGRTAGVASSGNQTVCGGVRGCTLKPDTSVFAASLIRPMAPLFTYATVWLFCMGNLGNLQKG